MKKRVFVDTSFWLASFLKNDKDYKISAKKFKEEVSSGSILFTSNDVIDEAVTRLVYGSNWGEAAKFIKYIKASIESGFLVELWTDEQVQDEAFTVLEKFKEHKLSLTDATSVVLLKRFKIECILTLDSHFMKVGVKVC